MRPFTLVVAVIVAAAFASTAPAHEVTAPTQLDLQGPAHQAGAALNMEVVGHNDLGGRGFNADVWVHKEFAYVGSWGFSDWNDGGEQRFCPNDGVAVIDTSDPRTRSSCGDARVAPGHVGRGRGGLHGQHGPLAGATSLSASRSAAAQPLRRRHLPGLPGLRRDRPSRIRSSSAA